MADKSLDHAALAQDIRVLTKKVTSFVALSSTAIASVPAPLERVATFDARAARSFPAFVRQRHCMNGHWEPHQALAATPFGYHSARRPLTACAALQATGLLSQMNNQLQKLRDKNQKAAEEALWIRVQLAASADYDPLQAAAAAAQPAPLALPAPPAAAAPCSTRPGVDSTAAASNGVLAAIGAVDQLGATDDLPGAAATLPGSTRAAITQPCDQQQPQHPLASAQQQREDEDAHGAAGGSAAREGGPGAADSDASLALCRGSPAHVPGVMVVNKAEALMSPLIQREVVQNGLGLPASPPVLLPKQVCAATRLSRACRGLLCCGWSCCGCCLLPPLLWPCLQPPPRRVTDDHTAAVAGPPPRTLSGVPDRLVHGGRILCLPRRARPLRQGGRRRVCVGRGGSAAGHFVGSPACWSTGQCSPALALAPAASLPVEVPPLQHFPIPPFLA